MTLPRVLVPAAAVLALALAGCSSSSDSGSDTPDPGALASSIAGMATSPAAPPASAGGGGDCRDAPTAAKAALTGVDYLDAGMVQGCTLLSVVTKLTDPGAGVAMCQRVAGEVWQLGVKSIVVVTADGTELATADPATPCKAS